MNRQQIIEHMSLSSSVFDWNERREEVSKELERTLYGDVSITVRGKQYSIPVHLSIVNRVIDQSGLIVKTLGNDSGKIYT